MTKESLFHSGAANVWRKIYFIKIDLPGFSSGWNLSFKELSKHCCLLIFAAKCKAGSFSPTGLDETKGSCVLCPKGTYSELNGSTECIPCPKGTTSLVLGASDMSECVGKSFFVFVNSQLHLLFRICF